MAPAEKPLVWLHGEVKSPPFSEQGRREAGFLLPRLQRGESPGMPHSRPMPGIGKRCRELRINDGLNTWRIVSRVDADAVIIAEVFSKKTAQTPKERDRHVQGAIEAVQRGLGLDQAEANAMRKEKREALERAGWKVGGAKDFLGLTDGDVAVIDMRLALAGELRKRRLAEKMTQAALAGRIGSSQSRVAKMEAGDPSVSLELLIRGLLASGSTSKSIGATIARAQPRGRR